MAKTRIYELARDLNMTNKILLDKLEELEIPAASHMSSLEDDVVEQIRAAVLGKEKKKELIEKRVRPTVIRRRRKAIKRKAAEAQAEAELQDSAQGPETEETEAPPPPVAETPAAVEADMATAEAPTVPAVEPPPAETPAPAATKTVRRKRVEPSAKVISKPVVEPPPVEEPPEVEAPAVQPEPEPEPVATTPEPEIAAPVDEKPAESVAEPAEPPPAEAEEAAAPPKEAKVIQKPKPAKTVKRPKTDTPAKIIKIATAPTREAIVAERAAAKNKSAGPRRPGADTGRQQPAATPAAADARKKKGKKRGEDDQQNRKFFKKKISFRKKEVIEGAALYAGGPKRGRKGRRGAKVHASSGQKTQITTPKAIKRRIKIDDAIVLSELGKRMGIKAADMIKTLMGLGVMATVNQTIDFDTAVLVAAEFDYDLEKASFEEETVLKVEADDPDKLQPRPPVVTIMGHVDHGKTSLLDTIRQTRITESEAGGITQHIGAYNVPTDKGQIIFLDTPGHEAFTAMRARGAKVTDIVVLVVAADDGVMPQTVEAINHSKAADVPIIVAVNKIDKANAQPDRVQRELAEAGLTPEDWGGDTIFVHVSAKEHQGIDELLEMILLQAELLELKANPDKLAKGHVVEAKLDSGRGAVATVLVQEGTLRAGEPIVCGLHYGKIRALLNDHGQQVDFAGPATPVEIVGLTGVPQAGDEMTALSDEKDAKQVSSYRIQKQRSRDLARTSRVSLDGLFDAIKEGEVKDLNLIIKADVHGSLEALRDSLTKLSNDEVKINVVHTATGTFNESDIPLATVSNAIFIGFNVRPSAKIVALANEENIDIRYYNVIYDVIKDVKDAIVGLMSSTYKEHVLGRAEVRQVFHVPKIGSIAGCYVTDGKVERGKPARLLREGVVSYDGKIGSLRRFKDDAREVQSGYECGIGIDNYNDIKVGDTIECYYMEEIKPELA